MWEPPVVLLCFIINLFLVDTLTKLEPPVVLIHFIKNPFVNIPSKPRTTSGPPTLHHQPSCCEHSSKLEPSALLLHFIINLLLANTLMKRKPLAVLLRFIINLLLTDTLMKSEPPTVLLRFINILIVNTLPKRKPPAVCFIINFHRLIQHHLQSNPVLSPCFNHFA